MRKHGSMNDGSGGIMNVDHILFWKVGKGVLEGYSLIRKSQTKEGQVKYFVTTIIIIRGTRVFMEI